MSWIEIERLFSQYGPLRELELDDDLKQHLEERGITRKHIVSFAEILEVFAGPPPGFWRISPLPDDERRW